MIGPLVIVAAALASAVAADVPVRVMLRPDVPWLVAVAAVDPIDGAVDAKAPQALLDAGGSLTVTTSDDGALVIVEGPPDAHDIVVAAARAFSRGARAAIFIEGRTSLGDTGAFSSWTPLHPSANAPSASSLTTTHALSLAPSPALLDVEGAALELFVDDALPNADAHIVVTRGVASLAFSVGDVDAAKRALAVFVAQPLAPKLVDALRTRAVGRIAARRSHIGVWAREMAQRFLALGVVDVDDAGDLGVHLRARVFPEALH